MIPFDPGSPTWTNDPDAEPPSSAADRRDRSRRLIAIMRAFLLLLIG
jgi:hypothetical protein